MESVEEILKVVGGLIFAAIYFFGGQIFKSKEEDETGPPTLPRQSGDRDNAEDEYAARQRQIQEAIRRKIMERRQAASEEATPPELVVQHREQRKEVVERQKETHQRSPRVEATPEVAEDDGRFSWDTSDNVYEQQMQARMQEIEATKRRAETLKRRAQSSAKPATAQSRRTPSVRGSVLSGSVRSVLRNPEAARTAFVYGEVLGKPVGLRPSGSGVE